MSKHMIRNICAVLFAVMFLFSFQTVAYATHDRYDDDDDWAGDDHEASRDDD